ncbi:hypothetical protein AX17_006386 [Amanita inopinata Kibby_2008]|nr:hypothetical protein AX17_006386 [Amanita inopinata Kibby_2008]
MSQKTYTQIPPPPAAFDEDPRAELSIPESEKYQAVLEHFSKEEFTIPGVGDDPQLSEEEIFWLSRECLLRYLRASKWKTATAIQRLEQTLKWRRDFGINTLVTAEQVEPEAVTGKEIVYGYDVHGRPGSYMFPSRQNTDGPTRQIQFAVWMLERCIDLMRPGVETLTLLINYADKAKSPSISTARAVLNILQDHYPERLGRALIIKIPFYINAFFKIIMPFVDPVTREKVKFNPEVVKDGYFVPDMLMNGTWEGACDFEYEHEKYWPALVSLCEERRKTWLERWRVLGAKVGIKEWDYKRQEDEQIEVLKIDTQPVVQQGYALPVVAEEPHEQAGADEHAGDMTIGVAVSCDEKKEEVGEAPQNGHANGDANGHVSVAEAVTTTATATVASADASGGSGDAAE